MTLTEPGEGSPMPLSGTSSGTESHESEVRRAGLTGSGNGSVPGPAAYEGLSPEDIEAVRGLGAGMKQALALAGAVADLRQEALFNFGEMTGVKLTAVLEQMLEHSELPDAYLDTVRAVFAPPEGYAAALRLLMEPGSVVVLLREPGAGRSFTAQALLADLRQRTGARVGPLSFGGGSRFPVRRLPREENVAYLLELPADEEKFEVADDFGAVLGKIQYTLGKRNSHLVVLTTPEQWARICRGAPSGVVPLLGRPDPTEIATAWLRAEAPELDASRWVQDTRITGLLCNQPPADVLQVVSLILNASRAPRRVSPASEITLPDAFTQQVLDVVAARNNWRSSLLQWHSKEGRTSFQRNFLLVAAMFRNAPVAHVYAQTAELSDHLKEREAVALEGQSSPGVIEMVDSIDAELTEDDTVQFSKPGWDDAVLNYFWVDRPMARTDFLAWMAKAPIARTTKFLETFTPEDRLLLANRVGTFAVRWAVRHGKANPLEEVVIAWRKDDALWATAVDLISAAALHPTMSRFVHAVLLRWSKNAAADRSALQKLSVDVCAGEFGRRHTGKALRRLRHVAETAHDDVQASLYRAVRNLWADASARPTLFSSVVEWCSADPSRTEAGRRSFLALATLLSQEDPGLPVLLSTGADQPEFPTADLVSGWRTLLDSGSVASESARAVSLWMDAAVEYPDQRPVVFNVLRGAVDTAGRAGGSHPRHRLRDLLYLWQPVPAVDADPERVRLRHELVDLLDHDRSRSVALYRPVRVGRGGPTP
ncbi:MULTISPECIES: hypothetical protein [unclassified Streptomyces]|uniref:hypothetical protein n=1 Tax=unclassified Streptomyces TaxID=2593676 RepID=UPI001F51B9D4|nr:hypothetical protein [Streptomyces sp. CB02058]